MGQLVFQATLGGAVNLIGPNIAGTVNFTLPSADGSSGQAISTNGSGVLSFGTLAVTAGGTGVTTSTGSGNNVLSTSPTLVTPILGTPTSVTLTNGTGLPLTTGVTGTLPVANGGTGLTSTPANGALDIGNGTGFTRTTLTAGTNVTITNGAGSITIAASGGGASAATPTALGTVYGSTNVSQRTAVGFEALNAGTATYNTAVGYQAGKVATGDQNAFFGWVAGFSTTTGANNCSFGNASMYSNQTGSNNSAFGQGALQNNTTASDNTAVGYQALYTNTTSLNNVAIGYQALYSMATTGVGNNSTAIGKFAGNAATGGGGVYVGYAAGYTCTAANNVYIGTNAGACNSVNATSGSNNVVIGNSVSLAGATNANSIVIGDNVNGKGSNTGFISAGGGGVYQGNNAATWSVTSDQRLKKNIVDNNIGLEKLTQIQVRNFEYRLPEEVTELAQDQAVKKQGVQLGVIAQELQAILPDCIKTESTGVMSVNSDNLTWYMINAIKELKAEFDAYKASHP